MLEIRTLRADEVDAAMDLFEAIVAERLWLGTEPGFDRVQRAMGLRRQLNDPASATFVALEDGVIVGQCSARPNAEGRYSLGIGVASAFRGRGIGRALMERTETWARAAGIAELTLLVFAHNERARAMYGALGYAEEAYYERDVVRQSGEVYDTIFMTKRLS